MLSLKSDQIDLQGGKKVVLMEGNERDDEENLEKVGQEDKKQQDLENTLMKEKHTQSKQQDFTGTATLRKENEESVNKEERCRQFKEHICFDNEENEENETIHRKMDGMEKQLDENSKTMKQNIKKKIIKKKQLRTQAKLQK